MNSQKSILISGYYGFDNSGDDAILKAIVKDIRDKNSEIDIKVLSNNPSKTESMYKVVGVNRFKFGEVFKAIKNTDLFISGGGSLLQDVTSTRSILYYLAIMKLTKIFGKPVMVYANGIGPIEKKLNRFLAKGVLNKVDLITLRDEASKKYVEDLGVKNKKIFVTSDPVFTLQAAPVDRIDEIFSLEGVAKDKPIIGISIRKWRRSNNLTEIMANAIKYMIKEYGVSVLLIPMHYPEDLDISLEINELVKEDDCYVLREKYNVEEIMGVINKLEIIVAMRLHSLIYAATQEVPMIGLSYDPKIDGILKSLGMEHILNVEDFTYEQLVRVLDIVWESRSDLREHLKMQDMELKNKALSNVTMALELLEK